MQSPSIGALGKDGVTSSIYTRALLRGTTLRPLMGRALQMIIRSVWRRN